MHEEEKTKSTIHITTIRTMFLRSINRLKSTSFYRLPRFQRVESLNPSLFTQNANFSSRIRRRRPTNASRVATATGSGTTTNHSRGNQKSIEEIENQRKRTEFQVNDMLESTATGMFIPKNENGEEVTMGEYLKFASLSPWVPCPDAVARRALDIVNAGENDIHYELGSGDGRLNFFAVDLYNVKKSVGIDIDPTMIAQSNERIRRRHPAPHNVHFLCADLIDESNPLTNEIWEQMGDECTILTMYFVEDALTKVRPLLEKHLLGKKCKIITVGYAMEKWEPKWCEVILGLTIHMYEMENIDDLYNIIADDEADAVIPEGDEELNIRSKEILASEQESNPFTEQRAKESTKMVSADDWDNVEMEDFDEDELACDLPSSSTTEHEK